MVEDAWADVSAVRDRGIADASCAVIARTVLAIVPRYAIGFVDGHGTVTVDAPDEGDPQSYWSNRVLLVNPLGGRENWESVARWVRTVGGDRARRTELAGLASEERPDRAANLALLRQAASEHRRAIALPPDEGFSSARAAEVSFIYDEATETLRAWKWRLRKDLATTTRGAPRKKR